MFENRGFWKFFDFRKIPIEIQRFPIFRYKHFGKVKFLEIFREKFLCDFPIICVLNRSRIFILEFLDRVPPLREMPLGRV